MLSQLIAQAPTDIIGTIDVPAGALQYDTQSGIGFGLFLFISNLIKMGTVIAGIYILFNFLLAGYAYITSAGNTKVNEEVKNKLTYSVVGMILIVSSHIAIGLLGLLFFGKANFFLQPEICGPVGTVNACP